MSWTTVGAAGTAQRTPELRTIVQEIVGRAGWGQGNALVLGLSGSGRRVAWSRDRSAASAARLHLEYATVRPPSFLAAEDVGISGVPAGEPRRLRVLLWNQGAQADTSTWRLEVARSETCADATWVAVGAGAPWQMSASADITDGEATTNEAGALTDPEGATFVAGYAQDVSATTASLTLAGGAFTELEYSVAPVAGVAVPGASYCFRVTDAGDVAGTSQAVWPAAGVGS